MKKVFFILFSLTLTAPSFAQLNWQDFQLEVVSSKEKPGLPFKQFELKDKAQHTFFLNFASTPSSDLMSEIIKRKNTFFSFNEISIKKLFITIEKNSTLFLLVPGKVAYADKDLSPFLPGGISFILSNNTLNYSFRVLRDTYSFKVDGEFTTEKELLGAILKTRELQQKTEFIEKNQDQLKERLLKAIKQNEETPQKQTPSHDDETSLPRTYLNLFLGSGTLAGTSLEFYPWQNLSLAPTLGISYFKETSITGESLALISLPTGLNLKISLIRNSLMQTYLFASGLYRIALQNTNNDFLYGAGAGQVLFEIFFAEAGYFMTSKNNNLTFGLGIRFSL